mmetsp:Transcript_92235/g.298626  ORF Transcript_92235/g.298626 Transcript_92235/m.298626 type:complete len:288 (-) Transcript_92235:234-1097(-)
MSSFHSLNENLSADCNSWRKSWRGRLVWVLRCECSQLFVEIHFVPVVRRMDSCNLATARYGAKPADLVEACLESIFEHAGIRELEILEIHGKRQVWYQPGAVDDEVARGEDIVRVRPACAPGDVGPLGRLTHRRRLQDNKLWVLRKHCSSDLYEPPLTAAVQEDVGIDPGAKLDCVVSEALVHKVQHAQEVCGHLHAAHVHKPAHRERPICGLRAPWPDLEEAPQEGRVVKGCIVHGPHGGQPGHPEAAQEAVLCAPGCQPGGWPVVQHHHLPYGRAGAREHPQLVW